MQRGVKDQMFADTLMMWLENKISNKGMNPNLATCQQLLESSFQQHQTQARLPKKHGTLTYQQIMVKSDATSPLDSYNNDTIDPAALKNAIQGICHNCKEPGHFACNCQVAKDTTQPAPLNANAPQFQAYYPIITPPTYLSAGQNALQDATPVRPADYYQPTYQRKSMTPLNMRFAELGEDKDLMNLFQAEISEDKNTDCKELVCDTGATHSLTNNCDSLLNFHVLTTPLLLSIATKTAGKRSFVTGVQSLVFMGTGDDFVVLENVFYSPSATAMLISPASIIRTGGRMYTKCNNLIFCNASDIPLLTATFHAPKRCWFFPRFLRKHEIKIQETVHTENLVSLTTRVGKENNNVARTGEKNDLVVWHKMFGLCGMRRLRNFLKDRLGIQISKHLAGNINDCADCLVAKSLRRSTLLPTD
ncbi:hypothetical protein O181_074049 [Austropuccinia psidii MF-1]|uniref:CCHC-type domain-containing protein n=1 Tax=Austropuccinia psidii MF-1 TaxID=1389203 RepID=A0A9Q3F8C6_9BASI|nr:hypothetical protein [Austropuccinia psidii MF-1]